MKILIVGDQHFRYELPYASAFSDGRKEEWESVKKMILDESKDCGAVVLLGDNFNQRHNHSSVIKEFVEFLKAFGDKEVHILVGNHERYGTSTALDFLKSIQHKNWHIYNEPQTTTVCGLTATMVPYMTPALMGVQTKEEAIEAIVGQFPKKADLLFAHHAVSGGTLRGMLVDLLNEIVLPGDTLRKHFGHTFAGHIHEREVMYPIFMTGNIFTSEIGEEEKCIYKYERSDTDPSDISVASIKLPVRGIYKMVWEELVEGIPKHSIVKCYVTSRDTNIEEVKANLSMFDAYIIVEQYPSERTKVHFDERGIDLSIESLLKLYADARDISYEDLKEGYELIK